MSDYPALPPLATTTVKHITFRGKTEAITLYNNGVYYDEEGTAIGIADANYSAPGSDNRCGTGFFSLPNGDPVNDACACHDYAFASGAYRFFHTRKDADAFLFQSLKQSPTEQHSLLPWIFYGLARLFGGLIPHNWKKDDDS